MSIYSSKPSLISSDDLQPYVRTDRNDFISTLVHSLVQTDSTKQTNLIESLRHQQQILGVNSKDIHVFAKNRRKHLSRKGNKLLSKTIRKVRHDAHQLRSKSPIKTDYQNYLFMNRLWNEYITELCKDVQTDENRLQRLITADYHGAIIRVVKSKNSSLVGKEGIVIQETKNVFVIVEKSRQKRCTILKKLCLFSIDVPCRDKSEYQTIFLSGPAISLRPEQRGQKRVTQIDYLDEFC